MTNNEVTVTNEHFIINRYRLPALEFFGVQLASASSWTEGARRWAEVSIYRTDRGRYITETIGRSTVPGERSILQVEVFREPEECSIGLRNQHEGRDFLTNLARSVLEEAAKVEPRIWNGNEQV